MVVQHNISAMNANRYYGINNKALAGSLEKLSSGYAINRAGDNAAGLAVSEKMRAQIGGLTQASKNAEDGISMVQTFEGALQETDSILQRMRTLAVQSANGNYQDDVDRDAIQLEFDQLNDELNHIADTDFNGVVMLNGGTMADGLDAVNGKFDYANKKDQVQAKVATNLQKNLTDAQNTYNTKNGELTINRDAAIARANSAYADAVSAANQARLSDSEVAAAQTAADAAQTAYTNGKFDVGETATVWKGLDNNQYDKDTADKLWQDLGLTTDGTTGSSATVDLTKGNKVEVTFELDADGKTWNVKSGAVYNGTTKLGDLTDDQKSAITTTSSEITDANGNGGFAVNSTQNASDLTAGDAPLGNAIFKENNVPKPGSTVTLVYTNDQSTKIAPDNIGFDANSVTITPDEDNNKGTIAAPKLTLGNITDAQMDDNMNAIYNALDGAELTVTYDGTADVSIAIGDDTYGTAGGATNGVTTFAGKDVYVAFDDSTNTMTISGLNAAGDGADADKTIATIKYSAPDANAATATVGTASGTIRVAMNDYSASSNISLSVGDDPTLGSGDVLLSNKTNADSALANAQSAADNRLNAALAAAEEAKNNAISEANARYAEEDAAAYKSVTDAQTALDDFNALQPNTNTDDWETVKTAYAQLQSSSGAPVSISDNFDNSAAKMTYAKDMVLQVGARTKDAVKFTFDYSTDDLGGLEKNLNCSARKEGLNTASLSLQTAEQANDAIDQIDKALNKVNMVRATFGSVQNRLEHKINNIDTNTENLTAAESRIRDTQMDKEMMKFTSAQILSQASQSMLAQANSLPQGVLQLLG